MAAVNVSWMRLISSGGQVRALSGGIPTLTIILMVPFLSTGHHNLNFLYVREIFESDDHFVPASLLKIQVEFNLVKQLESHFKYCLNF